MKVKVSYTEFSANVPRKVSKVYRVIPFGIPSGITSDVITQKGGLIAGTAAGSVAELPPGSAGQYLTPDPTSASGLKYETPSISVSDSSNFLINGGFAIAQKQAPGTLTTISDMAISADRWRITRENADLQYQRNDASGESGLTTNYYGRYKKITNAGKFMVVQPIISRTSIGLRGRTVIFQLKMKASSAKTIRMAVIELGSGGTFDTLPASIVTAWNADSTDPTLGSNLAVITATQSKSVLTTWANYSVSVTIPAASKNVLVAIWTDSDFAVNDTLDIAEAGLYIGSQTLAWAEKELPTEIAECRKFIYKTFALDTAPAQNAGVSGSLVCIAGKAGATASGAVAVLRFPTPMFGTLTTTTYNPAAANAQMRDVSITADCSATAVGAGYSNSEAVIVTATGNASTAVGNIIEVHLLVESNF